MSLISRLGYLVGTVLLVHAIYLAHELRHILKQPELALDIKLEAFAGMFVFVVASFLAKINPRQYGSVSGAPVAPKVAQNGASFFKPIKMNKAMIAREAEQFGPYDYITNRASFIDIVRKRREYEEWVQSEK